jgi:epoxyqueuosine reductase
MRVRAIFDDRNTFMDTVLRPLQDKTQTLTCCRIHAPRRTPNSRYPHKPVKVVDRGVGAG